MLPVNPELKSLDGARITVPAPIRPDWFASGLRDLRLAPLVWKRSVGVPAGEHRYEAWYLFREGAPGQDWEVELGEILEAMAGGSGGEAFHLASLIYPAMLGRHPGSWRLACRALFKSLIRTSPAGLWVCPEPESVSIWTDFAFHTWYAALPE